MAQFRCPVCGQSLTQGEKTFFCVNRHSYDRAKTGYVNLLRSQASGKKRHGDDKRMVAARSRFLEKGYYRCLLRAVTEEALEVTGPHPVILDAGCGECWYTDGLWQSFRAAGREPEVLGVDISKDALAAGGKRNRALRLAVASLFELPLADRSCDLVVNLFAPLALEEFRRVLKPGGTLLRGIPLERHLWGLKKAIYGTPYENEVDAPELPGLTFVKQREIRTVLRLNGTQEIADLFQMTPYYYKTGAADQAKAAELTTLETELEFAVRMYRREEKTG